MVKQFNDPPIRVEENGLCVLLTTITCPPHVFHRHTVARVKKVFPTGNYIIESLDQAHTTYAGDFEIEPAERAARGVKPGSTGEAQP